MKCLLLTLVFLLGTVCADSLDRLNEFSGDVDIYDAGTMKRGKNAGTWHHSYSGKFDIIYYLAMQPWRHLEWIEQDSTGKWVKLTMNEDNTVAWGTKNFVLQSEGQDFCRKQYTYPMEKFEIDWDNVPDSRNHLKSETINGMTCYEYAAKSPLTSVYVLNNRLLSEENILNSAFSLCRIVFIGGRNITFRSFNGLDTNFYNDFKKNTTDNCTIKAAASNVQTDIEILLGVSDKTAVKNMLEKLPVFADLSIARSMKIKYLTKTGIGSMTIPKKSDGQFDLTYSKVQNIMPPRSPIDSLVDAAVSDFETLKKQGNFKRGTIIAFVDQEFKKIRDAGREFERHNGYETKKTESGETEIFRPENSVNITIFINALNSQKSKSFTAAALSHVALGYHYKESTNVDSFTTAIDAIHTALVANLTERCDTETCSGFCDGANRCTCPMCCENDCYYTYCNVEMASCEPWPKGAPKKKVDCKEDCVGTYECKDGLGCVIKEYNAGCQPPAKCMAPYCDSKNKCDFKSTCQNDLTPENDEYCYEYKCDENSGECVKTGNHGNKCPKKGSLCQELYCNADLSCGIREKQCVKTEPYTEYACYEAKCNIKTGMCENRMSCDSFTSCGGSKKTKCECTSATSGECHCEKSEDDCDSSKGEVCDYTLANPKCIVSKCPLDRIKSGCMIRECNSETKENFWQTMDCSNAVNNRTLVSEECKDTVMGVCSEGECGVVNKTENSYILEGGCRVCYPAANGTVIGHDRCTGKVTLLSKNVLTQICVNGTEENEYTDAKCEFPDYNCTKDDVELKEGQCASNYDFSYDKINAKCTPVLKPASGECMTCENDQLVPFCKDKKIENHTTIKNISTLINENFEFEYKDIEVEYTINKICNLEKCIPDPLYNCYLVLNKYNLSSCSNIKATYHYSEYFDRDYFEQGIAQKDAFYNEADRNAYCVFEVENKDCSACVFGEGAQRGVMKEACDGQTTKKYGFIYACNTTKNVCEPLDDGFECQIKDCYGYDEKLINDTRECVKNESNYLCQGAVDDFNRRRENGNKNDLKMKIECGEVKCVGSKTCVTNVESDVCKYQGETYEVAGKKHKFGCTVPTGLCAQKSGYYCEEKTLQHITEETNDLFKVDENGYKYTKEDIENKCRQYVCVNDDVKGHYWKIASEKKAEPRHLCETAKCNTETGEIEYTEKNCVLKEHFPDIGDDAARCNYCTCNYKDGTMVLQIYENNDKEIYSFDACGNCIVNDTLTGLQINEKKACKLEDKVDNKGVIAAATTVGIVVVAVVVAIVVVGIGALQTFQLVSSAMKNTVTSMNENPNFEAADKQATNANFQG